MPFLCDYSSGRVAVCREGELVAEGHELQKMRGELNLEITHRIQ